MKITTLLGLLLLLSSCGVSDRQQKSTSVQAALDDQQVKNNLQSESAQELGDKSIVEMNPIDEAIVSLVSQSVKQDKANDKYEDSILVKSLCKEIGNTLGSVSVADCLAQNFDVTGVVSVKGRPIV